jgi:hypothetical protein
MKTPITNRRASAWLLYDRQADDAKAIELMAASAQPPVHITPHEPA